MKQILLGVAFVLFATAYTQAQDTTKIIIGTKTIIIINNDGKGNKEININEMIDSAHAETDSMHIQIEKNEEDMEKFGRDMKKFAEDMEEMGEGLSSITEKEQDKSIAHWAGFEMGVNGWMNANNTLDLENPKYDLDYSNSLFYNLNVVEQKIPFFGGYGGLVTGLGFNFNEFSFKGATQLSFNEDSTWAFTRSDYNFKRNRLNVTYLTLPMMLEFNTSLDEDKSFHIAFGVLGGFKLFSKTKQKYDFEGDNYKVNVRGHYNVNPWKADAVARIGYKSLTLFANYPLTQFFEKNTGPEMYTFQVGLRLIDF